MAIRKNIIKESIVDLKDIEKFALDSARKALEETMAPQIEEAVINSLKQIQNDEEISENVENEKIEEGIKLDIAPDADLTINLSSDGAEISLGDTESSIDTTNNTNTEMDIPNSQEDEIYEVEGLGDASTANAPVDNAGATANEPTTPDTDENKLDILLSKMDTIIAAIAPEAGNPGGTEGAVDVVDDDEAQSQLPDQNAAANVPPTPAPVQGTAPEANPMTEDDVMYQIDEEMLGLSNSVVTEDSIDEISLDELENIEEIEIVDEDEKVSDEDTVDEMRGLSFSVNRSAQHRNNFEKNNEKHAPVSVNEGEENKTAQEESKIDELQKENKRLSEAIKQYKINLKEAETSFVELRKQINELYVFNGKLAYANKIFVKGGMTKDEKMNIAEAFDKAETIEEAKKLYNKLVTEMNAASSVGTAINKLTNNNKPAISQSQTVKSETIFESEEKKRRMKLAGILKENSELSK